MMPLGYPRTAVPTGSEAEIATVLIVVCGCLATICTVEIDDESMRYDWGNKVLTRNRSFQTQHGELAYAL